MKKARTGTATFRVKGIRRTPSPALVISCIALAIALGGTSYAAGILPINSVGTPQLKQGAVVSSKVRDDSLAGRDVNEALLGKVPSAENAEKLGGWTRSQFMPRLSAFASYAQGFGYAPNDVAPNRWIADTPGGQLNVYCSTAESFLVYWNKSPSSQYVLADHATDGFTYSLAPGVQVWIRGVTDKPAFRHYTVVIRNGLDTSLSLHVRAEVMLYRRADSSCDGTVEISYLPRP